MVLRKLGRRGALLPGPILPCAPPLPLMLLNPENNKFFLVVRMQGYTAFGKNAGCSFLGDSCTDFAISNPKQNFFCDVRGEFSCSHDNRYMSTCSEV